MHSYWETTFKRNINWYSEYFLINKCLVDNRIKQLKIKLIHNIMPTNENLFKWKQTNSPLCKHCNEVENLAHFFIQCPYVNTFWNKLHTLFKRQGICKQFDLFDIIIGYKVDLKEYNCFNIILCHITYTIYKGYFKSDRRSKAINMLKILYQDLLIVEKYFVNKNQSNRTLKQFIKSLKEII